MYGDRTGRTRMSQDGQTLKNPYIAKGLAIVTGEMLPDVPQSRLARSLILTIHKDSIDLNKLSALQANTDELAYCMKEFIRWIINNEASVVEYINSAFTTNQQLQNSLIGVHGRTKEIVSILPLGFTLFTLFAYKNNVISETEMNNLNDKIIQVLNSLMQSQTQEIEELKPVDMFYSAIEELLQSYAIRVLNIATGIAIGAGKEVGFYDPRKEVLYLHPTLIYNEVLKFYNNKFPIPPNTLWRYLAEEGLLYQNDKKRYKVSRRILGEDCSVIEINASRISMLKRYSITIN
jgi:hypothetical protein